MSQKKVYEVYKDGMPIVWGTADECAEALGITAKHFRKMANDPDYTKYKIVDPATDKASNTGYKNAIKDWDDFVTPIRERYGIPVYKAKKG